jgi:hypothetical protein
MNTVSIIVTIFIPLFVVGTIIVDLLLRQPAKVNQMSYDSKIDDIIYSSGENDGFRLSQEEILDNTSYFLNNYAEIM